jgi:hypothetical protein
VEAIEDIRASFPVPVKGIDTDNGAEFINWHLKGWCESHSVTFTRGRQYHKNDNAFVEQKNGDIVRKAAGYGRFADDNALCALCAVYAALNQLYNFFYPNMKRVDKKQAVTDGSPNIPRAVQTACISLMVRFYFEIPPRPFGQVFS